MDEQWREWELGRGFSAPPVAESFTGGAHYTSHGNRGARNSFQFREGTGTADFFEQLFGRWVVAGPVPAWRAGDPGRKTSRGTGAAI